MRLCNKIVLLVSLGLAACGSAGDTPGVSTDPNGATGFVTIAKASAAQPASAPGMLVVDADGRPYGYRLLGQNLPEVEGRLASGGRFSTASINKWTIIDVWGIWCSDCMADAPYVAALARAVEQDPDLDFLSIHTPPSRARAEEALGRYSSVEDWFAEKGFSYPVLIDDDASIRERLQIEWTPTYLLVSPTGRVEAFRTDLSVAGGTPVKDFLIDVAGVRGAWTPPAPDADAYRMGKGGLGWLDGRLAFTLKAVETAFPGLVVTPGVSMSEGETYPVFEITRTPGGPVLFTLEPGWKRGHVGAIITRSEDITGPDGEIIGAARMKDIGEIEPATCKAGLEEYADRLICKTGRMVWIFSLPASYVGPADDAPEDLRRDAILAEMRALAPTER